MVSSLYVHMYVCMDTRPTTTVLKGRRRRKLGLISSTPSHCESGYVLHEMNLSYVVVVMYVRHTLRQWWENVQFHQMQHDLEKTALAHFKRTTYCKVCMLPLLSYSSQLRTLLQHCSIHC